MSHRFTRHELYEIVWSEPMKKLAPRFGISACRDRATTQPREDQAIYFRDAADAKCETRNKFKSSND